MPAVLSDSPLPSSEPAAHLPDTLWVPIRSLTPRHRSRIAAHLLALAPHDRYLRFGYAASDDQIQRYVAGLDFERDEVFGIFNRRLSLIAMAHLAQLPPAADGTREAEFGVSVRQDARSRGFGARLFALASLHARNRDVDTIVIHALSENHAMLKIADAAGASIVRRGPEAQACVKLPPDDMASRVREIALQQAAEWDYGLKAQARSLGEWIDSMADLKGSLGKRHRPPGD